MLPLWTDAGNGVCVGRLGKVEHIETLVHLFETVADVEGWQPEGALRLWLPRSVYFAVEVNAQCVGGLQLVLPDAAGNLPCQTLWPDVPVPASGRSAHVAMLALEEAVRGQSLLFWRLAVEMWRHCVGEGIAKLFIEVTPRVLPLYRRLGWPLVIVGELRPHWGEDCYLCTLGIPDVAQTLLRKAETSAYYRQIIAQAFRVTLTAHEIGRENAGENELLLSAVA